MTETDTENKPLSDIEEFKRVQAMNEIENMSDDSKIEILAKFIGYKSIPPTIDQFLDDDYYLGKIGKTLFPFWREKLRLIYPTAIHTRYPIVVFKGGVGTGKSTIAKVMAEYMKCRILFLDDIDKTFGRTPGKNIKFAFFHKKADLAETDFLLTLREWESELSPFFRECKESGRMKWIEQVADSTRTNATIGSDVLFYNFSEINFVEKKAAYEKLDSGFKRWDSRFRFVRPYFGNIILDTSSREDDSIAEEFIENNPFGDQVITISTNQWKVREGLNQYGREGWFKVYTGDSIHSPFIVDSYNVLTDEMDPDRVIDVPKELESNFRFGLEKALQDLAGISTTSSDKLFLNTTNLERCFNLPQNSPDVVKFDFYDKMDKLIYRFSRSIDSIPDDKIIYIRYDVGITGDNTGLAIAYFDSWKTYNFSKNLKQPRLIIPLAVGINRYEGSETPIYHLYEFVMDLNERFQIGGFSADQFGSAQLIQDLKREGITAKKISVDKTDEAYIYFKMLANNGLISLPNNKLLLKELKELKRQNNKVDHPKNGCFVGNTLVLVIDKYNKERLIKIKDLVDSYSDYEIITYNESTKEFERSKIKKVWKTKEESELITLRFGSGFEVTCTRDHQILTSDGYLNADKFKLRSTAVCRGFGEKAFDTEVTGRDVFSLRFKVPVYDIEVESENHNFCVSGTNIVVHNSKDIADAVSGAVFHLYQNIDKAGQLSTKNISKLYSDMGSLSGAAYNPQNTIQEMYNKLF